MNLDFAKGDGLLPVIIQDNATFEVLMLGFMNQEAFEKTREEGRVTFYSRTRGRLWTKGEESGNYLEVVEIAADCDSDTLLIRVKPSGPVCHTGSRNCFNTQYSGNFIFKLQEIIDERYEASSEGSYVQKMRNKGLNKIAQKVGEEAVETVIAALAESEQDFVGEAADLVFHLSLLLREKNISLDEVARELERRHSTRQSAHA